MNETFRGRLLRGDNLIGTIICLPAPELAEIVRELNPPGPDRRPPGFLLREWARPALEVSLDSPV
jgi:hypothetical protein